MQTAYVSVVINGAQYNGWEEITVEASVKEAARSFSLKIAAEMGGTAAATLFALFSPVQIFESGEMVFSGYVDRRAPKLGKDEAYITISGRAKGQDAIDSSAMHPTGRFDNQTPLQIAQTLDKFGIGFTTDAQLTAVPEYQLKPGATVFREIEKLCRDQGVTLAGQADGSIKLTQAGKTAQRQAGALIEGKNIEEIEGSFSGDNIHSEARVRGQSYDGNGPDALQIEGLASNSTVPRYRPLVLVQDANTDKTRAKNRATNRRDKEMGDGIRAAAEVVGWRDDDGELWMPGNIVWVSSPFLALEQDMLIETLTYHQNEKGKGSTTQLHLVDPRAHGGSGSQAGQSGPAWGFPSSEGTDD
jgi:prophage tail gpP-like protein